MIVRPAAAALAAIAAISMTLGGCAREVGGDVYDTRDLSAAVRTERGVVESVRPVRLQDGERLQEPGLGALIGGAAGGAVGREIGAGWGQIVAIGAGIVLGAAAGALAQGELSKQDGLEYVVKTTDGRLFTIVQGVEDPIATGSPVFIQFGDSRTRARVVRA
jgi:outer membrane lipoprotein SlyB